MLLCNIFLVLLYKLCIMVDLTFQVLILILKISNLLFMCFCNQALCSPIKGINLIYLLNLLLCKLVHITLTKNLPLRAFF
nr:MAG TPA: hypothetical protein [Caudoviricetes sp.]